MTMKQMCEHIEKAGFLGAPTAEEIFNYSPTSELYNVFMWYKIACKILGYEADDNAIKELI